jgi:hypothetical protein
MRRNLCILLSIAAPVFALLLVATGSAQADAGASSLLQAGAPAVVSYQGQVMVGGDPYTGTGYFKFAVVSAGGGRRSGPTTVHPLPAGSRPMPSA